MLRLFTAAPDYFQPHSRGGLRQRVVEGAVVISSAQAAKIALQLASVVLLSRLLSPDTFGLFAMVIPVVAFIMALQDLGLTQAIITSSGLTHKEASNMFWIHLATTVGLAGFLLAAAPLIASFYGEPRLTQLAMALSAALFFAGLGTVPAALLNRTMRFGTVAIVETMAGLVGVAVAVGVAMVVPTVWALAAATIVGMAVGAALFWAVCGWKPDRPDPATRVGGLVRIGGGVAGFNLTDFVARNADHVLIGRFAGAVQLGLYDRAYKLLLFPLQHVTNPVGRVMIPALSRLRNEPDRYRAAYRRAVQLMLLLLLPGIVFVLIFAEAVVVSLLGEDWRAAAPIFAWLAITGLHQPMTSTIAWLFVSQQRTGAFARWGLVSMTICLAAFAVGLPWGAVGVAAAYAVADLCLRVPLVWWYAGRSGPVSTTDLVRIAWPFLPAMAAASLAALAVRHVILPEILRLALGVLASYAAALPALCATRGGRLILREAGAVALDQLRRPGRAWRRQVPIQP